MRPNKELITSLFLLFIVIASSGQSVPDLGALQAKYPGRDEVVLLDEIKYIIKEKKGELFVTQDAFYESLILNKNGISNSTESFYESELSLVDSYDAYTISTDNSKVTTNQLEESGNTDGAIFYDGVVKTTVTYKALELGSRKVLNYTTVFEDPHLLHRFVFKKYLPLEKSKIVVEFDDDIEIGYKLINTEGADIKFTEEKKRKKTIYTWERTNIPGYKFERNMPSILYSEPHIAIYVKSYEGEDGRKKVLDEVDDLYSYYSAFVEGLNEDITKELENIAKELTSEIENEEEKVKALYYWVKDNIKYIAYENGYEGFIPREASLICERKFGDCKDMASILTAMCQSVGIDKVKLTWIGTRDLPYDYKEMPTPGVDNHMIAAYLKGDEVIFLDGTDQQVAYPLPSSFIQGKEALIGKSSSDFLLHKVPVITAEVNKQTFEINCSLDKSLIQGTGKIAYYGLSRVKNVSSLNTLNEKRRFDGIKRKASLANNKFILESYEEENTNNRDLPFTINYKFNVDNYVVTVDDETYINLFFKKMGLLKELEEDRQYPFEIDELVKYDLSITVNLEENMTIIDKPDDFLIDNDIILFECKYTAEKDKLTLNYTVETKMLLMQPEYFSLWNKTMKKIKAVMKENATIKTK